MQSFKTAIKKVSIQLTVTQPKARSPLLRLIGVAGDDRVTEGIKSQNSGHNQSTSQNVEHSVRTETAAGLSDLRD